jgi:hypothetical protein
MKEVQKDVLVGVDDSTNCYQTMLTIDRNTKRVYRSFTRTKYADNFDKIKSGICGASRPIEVLMNCTAWAKNRKTDGAAPSRYCDFGGMNSK